MSTKITKILSGKYNIISILLGDHKNTITITIYIVQHSQFLVIKPFPEKMVNF